MLRGLIPIITRECGYNSYPCIIELEKHTVEYIRNYRAFGWNSPLVGREP